MGLTFLRGHRRFIGVGRNPRPGNEMDLLEVFYRYPDQEACIAQFEAIRFNPDPFCPLCGGMSVARKADGARVGRWNCFDCKSSFNVLSGTIFSKTRIPLQKWFLAICLMTNAKKSLSSPQLARDIELTQPTALYLQQRIRAAMLTDAAPLLYGIVEADETYIGGKPRRSNRPEDHKPNPRGRGTKKTPVVGVVERGGRVVAKMATDLSGKAMVRFLKETVDPAGSLLMTDDYPGYRGVSKHMDHAVINHRRAYVDGQVHTNTIEGFWSLLKRAWYGTHHHYTVKFLPLYVAEGCWKS